LLAEAERADFDVLLTADKNMRHQQNLRGRKDRPCGVEHSAMACCSIAHRKNRGGRERRHAWQLHRGESTGIGKPDVQIGAPPAQRVSLINRVPNGSGPRFGERWGLTRKV
jgi:hypothetical protein